MSDPTTISNPVIPEPAIRYLRANPATASLFDEHYGVGQAQRVLTEKPQKGLLATAGDAVKGAARGAVNAVNETIDAVDSGAAFLASKVGDIRYTPGRGIEALSAEEVRARDSQSDDDGLFTLRAPNFDEPETLAGSLTQGATQFITGLVGLGKLTKLSKLDGLMGAGKAAVVAGAAARSATVAAVAFDPYEGNVANFVEQYPSLQSPVTEFLAAGEEDGEVVARLKNALADVAVGVPLDLAVQGFKALRAKKQGRLEDAERHLEEMADADTKATEAPAAQPAAPKGSSEVPGGTASADAVEPAAGTVTKTRKVDALVTDVTGRGARTASASDTAKNPDGSPAELINGPVQLDDATRADLMDKIKLTVERDARRGGDPWSGFFQSGHDFNIQKIIESGGNARGALHIMQDIGETFRTQIDEARGGSERTFDTVRAEASRMARLTGNDPGEFLNMLASDAKSAKDVEARLYAYKNFTLSLADSVKGLAQMIEQGTHGTRFASMDELAQEFGRRAEFLANVQAMTKAVQSGTARAVSAGRLGAKISPAMSKHIESGKFGDSSAMDTDALRRLAKVVASSADEDVLAQVRMSKMDGLGHAVHRYWINSILSGPATHIVNATSNFLKGASQVGEEYLAGVYSADAKQRAMAVRTLVEMSHQTVGAFRVARKALNAGDNILDARQTIGDNRIKQVSAEELAQAIEAGQYGAAIVKATDALFSYPTRLLATSDEFFKQISYRSRVSAKAHVDGQEAGLRGAELAAYVEQRMQASINPANGAAYDDLGKPLDADALRYAQETTFTQPLDPDGLAAGIQVFANRSPWLRLILPFIKTPANVLSDWWRRSPLHLENYRDLAAGGQRRSLAAARLTAGASFYTTAGLLASSGVLTGMGPQDAETKRLWKAAGNQPYSIKVGDKWIGYNRMDPFGMFFGIAADISELAGHTDDRDGEKMMEMALMSFTRNLSNKTYLRGLADVMDALFERGPQADEKVARLMQSYAAGFTPFSGYLNSLKNDPYMREVRSMVDASAQRVPGFSAELDPQRNILGEITMASEMGGISPWAVTTDKADPLAEELVRIHEATGEQMKKPPRKTGTIDWTTFKGTDGKSAYDRFLALHAELGLRKAMQGAMKTPGWERLSDQGRVEQFRAVTSRIRTAARKTVFKEFPDLRDAVIEQERMERLGLLRPAEAQQQQ